MNLTLLRVNFTFIHNCDTFILIFSEYDSNNSTLNLLVLNLSIEEFEVLGYSVLQVFTFALWITTL